jgi:hypothetical protein
VILVVLLMQSLDHLVFALQDQPPVLLLLLLL